MSAYQLACEDAGHAECAFMVRSEDRDEVVELVREHAKETHNETHSRSDVEDLVKRSDWTANA